MCIRGDIDSENQRSTKLSVEGSLLHVSGKTDERIVRIAGDSVRYLREWVQQH